VAGQAIWRNSACSRGFIAGRAITGNAPLGDVLAACVTLIAVHWLFSLISCSSTLFSDLIKGSSTRIIEDGHVLRKACGASTCPTTTCARISEVRVSQIPRGLPKPALSATASCLW